MSQHLFCPLPFTARGRTDQIEKPLQTRSPPCSIASVDLARLLCLPRNPPNDPRFRDIITLDKAVHLACLPYLPRNPQMFLFSHSKVVLLELMPKCLSLRRCRRSDFEPRTRGATNSGDKANQSIEDAEAFSEDSVGT